MGDIKFHCLLFSIGCIREVSSIPDPFLINLFPNFDTIPSGGKIMEDIKTPFSEERKGVFYSLKEYE
jgi:hypothetical protein